MKKTKILGILMVFAILSTFTGCNTQQGENRTVVKDSGKTITIIDKKDTESEQDFISVEKIDQYDKMEITDWLDEHTVLLAKENSELDKMSLVEKSEYYPRSLYLYDLATKEYKAIKAPKNMFLGGPRLSPDKKHLLYHEYSIGDRSFYLMTMDDSDLNNVTDEVIGLAMTAQWAVDNNVIGVSYAGGAYQVDRNLISTNITDLQYDQLFTIHKTRNKIYYITMSDTLDMYILDMDTNSKKKLKIENANGIIPSSDGKQILITNSSESGSALFVADAEGNILRTVAEGAEITGASWSPNQMMIAYQLSNVINGVDSSGLYIYDVLAGDSARIAVNFSAAEMSWSPSGNKLAVTQYDDGYYNSSIIYLGEKGTSQVEDMGYITAIDRENKTISIDRAELIFATDEERLAELGMTSEDLVTGFTIYNEDNNIEILTYGDNISIELLDGPLKLESSLDDLEDVLDKYNVLANFTLIDKKVVLVSEQYLP